jgi:hypothetical protein
MKLDFQIVQDYAVDSVKLEWLLRKNEPTESGSSSGSRCDDNGTKKLNR